MEAKLLLTRAQATTIYSLIHLMTGQVSFRAKREEVQKKLSTTWPEIMVTTPSMDERDAKEKREVILNEREQKAMGEGLLSLVSQEKANGADYKNCLELACLLRISTWFRKAATVQEVPEFDEPLDDETVCDELNP
jgi:hypothetical protein